jgi:hypothetical protein
LTAWCSSHHSRYPTRRSRFQMGQIKQRPGTLRG